MTAKQERNLKKRLRADADRLWHQACIKMWGNTCMFHNHEKQADEHTKKAKYSHHFFAKGAGYGWLRYCIDIGVPLCWACHNKLEQLDTSMNDDVVKIRGINWFYKVTKLSKEKRTSFETVEWYKENIERLKEYISTEK